MGGRRESAAPSCPKPQASQRPLDQREGRRQRAEDAPWCAGAPRSTSPGACESGRRRLCPPC
eukprot:331102-Alexandrium_andersonii.AAC.1